MKQHLLEAKIKNSERVGSNLTWVRLVLFFQDHDLGLSIIILGGPLKNKNWDCCQ